MNWTNDLPFFTEVGVKSLRLRFVFVFLQECRRVRTNHGRAPPVFRDLIAVASARIVHVEVHCVWHRPLFWIVYLGTRLASPRCQFRRSPTPRAASRQRAAACSLALSR